MNEKMNENTETSVNGVKQILLAGVTLILLILFASIASWVAVKSVQELTEEHVVTVVNVYKDCNVLFDGEITTVQDCYYVTIELEDGQIETVDNRKLYEALKDKIGEQVELIRHKKTYHSVTLRYYYELK